MIDLACLAQRLRAQGRTLWLRSPQPNIRTLIETVGLHRLPAVRFDAPRPPRPDARGLDARGERAPRASWRSVLATSRRPNSADHQAAQRARGHLSRAQRTRVPPSPGLELDREVGRRGEARRRLAVQALGLVAPGEPARRLPRRERLVDLRAAWSPSDRAGGGAGRRPRPRAPRRARRTRTIAAAAPGRRPAATARPAMRGRCALPVTSIMPSTLPLRSVCERFRS